MQTESCMVLIDNSSPLIKTLNKIMQGISDPQTFQLSEIVQKSSKSGIFTNKRLLMIKDGFLYYFSTVPSDYKAHEPNIMSSLKEFPKCSIEIRSIQNIKLESAKSSTLIITFYDRDMIDRQDIRKSLSSKNYNHPVKQSSSDEQEEWKFIFATVMKCRLWYGSLVKLKQHFVKNQDKFDKFTEYMANFDPQIRNSLPQFSPSNANNLNRSSTPLVDSPTKPTSGNNLPSFIQTNENTSSKYKMEKESGIFAIQESSEEYDEEITPKNSRNMKLQEQKKTIVKEQKKIVEEKPQIKEVVALNRGDNTNKAEKKIQDPSIIKVSEPKKPEVQIEKENQQFFQQIQNQIIKQQVQTPIKPEPPSIQNSPQIPDQKELEKENFKKAKEKLQIEQIFQQQQKRHAEEQAILFSKQLQLKQELIRKMAEQIESNKKAKQQLEERIKEEAERRQEEQRLRIMLEREKKEEEEYRRLKESIKSQPFVSDISSKENNKQVVVRQESIQTEYERDFIEVIQGNFKQTTKNSRYSFKSDLSLNHASVQRQTLNLFRNTISYISQVKIQSINSQVELYDYFWEIGQLYKSSNLKERIAKELELAEFVRKASRKASDMVTHYIDLNRPRESLKIDRNLFQIEIVCDRGRVIRTQGSQRLIYPNENHQRLKRAFKIYNKLNEIIISILKKKPNFPLRVPFACLVEYKGYTALARIIPPLKENTINAQFLKNLSPSIPTYNLALNDFQSHGIIYTLLQPTLYFKATKQDETSIVRFPQKNNDFLMANRKANISISSKKLFDESKQIENYSKERLQLAEKVTLCRQLKKIMKANTPYLQDSKEFQFFDDFLKNPSIFMDQIIETTEHKITGLMLYYIQKLLGIRLKAKLTQASIPQYFAISVKRMFSLESLDVSNFASNYQRYVFQQKYELAEKSLAYFKQLQEDYAQTLMKEVSLHINQNQFQETLEKLELAEEMMSIHDPRRLKIIQLRSQCYEAVGDIGNALASLKSLLEEAEYMYGKNSKLVEIYFLIAELLSRQKLIPQLIQVYRKILQENPDYRNKVLIDFSSNLLYQDTDPHILLDFLQKQLPGSIEQNHPEIQQLLGELYFKVKNRPKALGFFTNSLNNILNQGKRSDKIYQIFTKIIECCSSTKQKKALHRQIYAKMNALNFSKNDEGQGINTYTCCIICEPFLENQRDNLIVFMEYSKKTAPLRLLEWSWLESILKRIAKGQHVSQQQKSIFVGSIDANAFTQHLILLNNPNFI